MPGQTQEQLDALIAQHGGEIGGPGAGRQPLPPRKVKTLYPGTGVGDVPPYYVETDAPTQYRIQTAKGDIVVEPQDDGTYGLVSAPNAPTPTRGTEGGAPYITGGQRFDPTTNTMVDIPGYRDPRQPSQPTNVGGEFWRYNEATGQMELVGSSQSAIADRQAIANERAATAQRAAATEQRLNMEAQLAAIKAAEAANEIDAKRAQELRDYLYKTQVEEPAKRLHDEDVLKQAAVTYGQQAGTSAVSDVTSMLPYRYSPGFMERRDDALAGFAKGNFRPGAIARGYTGPDLTGTRQQAETQYQNQYLDQFGFDPRQTANQIGYRLPAAQPPGAPAPAGPSGDDEEYLKQLARQLAGGG